MLRKGFFVIAYLLIQLSVFAQLPNNLEGDWSGVWNTNNPLTLRGNIRYALVQAGATGTRDFLFNDGPGDYNPEFKLKFFLTNPQNLDTRILDPLTTGGNNIQFNATTGHWYMMIVESAPDNNDLAILELDSQPQTIDTVTRCPILPNSMATVSLSARNSLQLGANEQLWVHYSSDNFVTSSFAQLTGNPLAATLPAFPHDTTVRYYFLTTNSSITLNANDVAYQAFDILYQGSYGTYFSYTVDDSMGTIGTPCFVFPTVEICGDGEDNDGDGLADGFDLDCGLCAGTLGDNVIAGGDFGTVTTDGQNAMQPDPAANPGIVLGNALGANVTNYAYGFNANFSCVNGSDCFPDDGNYVIATSTRGMLNPPSNTSNWIEIEDNGPEADGYFMVINAAPDPGIFYQFDIVNLCPSTVYEFSADVINLIPPVRTGLIPPNIDFILADTGATLAELQTVVAAANTGNVPQDSAWNTFGFTFIPNSNALTLALRNNNPGGQVNVGNDLAIDNISFRACGPTVSLVNPGVFCPGNTVLLDANVSPGYLNPVYQWQYSGDGGQTWSNVATATSEDFVFTSTANSDSGQYRLLIAEDGNINDSLCRIVSNAVHLELQCPLENSTSPQNLSPEHDLELKIIPNPNHGRFDFSFFVNKKQTVRCEMWDVTGKQLWKKSIDIQEIGHQRLSHQVEALPAAMYLFVLYQEENMEVKRFVIH